MQSSSLREESQHSLQISWLQAALLSSDLIVTVNQRHSEELRLAASDALNLPSTESFCRVSEPSPAQVAVGGPLPSAPMASSLLLGAPGIRPAQLLMHGGPADNSKQRKLKGIMNGIDISVWNPASDPHLPRAARYGPDNVRSGKQAAKMLLQVTHTAFMSSMLFSAATLCCQSHTLRVLLSPCTSTFPPP